jgi:hypothetical protein
MVTSAPWRASFSSTAMAAAADQRARFSNALSGVCVIEGFVNMQFLAPFCTTLADDVGFGVSSGIIDTEAATNMLSDVTAVSLFDRARKEADTIICAGLGKLHVGSAAIKNHPMNCLWSDHMAPKLIRVATMLEPPGNVLFHRALLWLVAAAIYTGTLFIDVPDGKAGDALRTTVKIFAASSRYLPPHASPATNGPVTTATAAAAGAGWVPAGKKAPRPAPAGSAAGAWAEEAGASSKAADDVDWAALVAEMKEEGLTGAYAIANPNTKIGDWCWLHGPDSDHVFAQCHYCRKGVSKIFPGILAPRGTQLPRERLGSGWTVNQYRAACKPPMPKLVGAAAAKAAAPTLRQVGV